MITVEHLTKCYGDFLAVDDLSFEIEEGHVYGFLGPNGAGKSTTMNIITGCLSATSGRVRIDGHDIFEEPGAAKRLIGYLPEQPPLYLNETPVEYLRFVGEAKGLRGGALERQIAEVVEQTRLTGVRHRCISALSKGYRQRVGIAQALLGSPRVIILDEPTVGLDPLQIIEIRELIRQLGQTHTVLFSSHILSEVQTICDQILMIAHGKLAAFGAPDLSIAQVDLMEKGYADLELTVRSIGGHSSRPYGGTSLAHLACAIADIVRSPFPVRLNPAMMGAFETLAPYITAEPLKTLTRDVRANADAIAAYYCYQSPALFPFVTTTIAPTVIQGSSRACNVMPQDMQAVINFRLADGDTVESVMEHCRAAVQDPTVELRYQQANDPSATARRDGYGYRTVVDSMQRYYPDVVFVPSMTVGATDAHQYEQICDTCLRCSPFMAEPEEAASGVHGTNERILVRAYLQGIRVLIDLMEHANL
mgnify:CR=1 FL=1